MPSVSSLRSSLRRSWGRVCTYRKHHHSAHVQARAVAVSAHLLDIGVVGNLDHSLEHRVRHHRLGHFNLVSLARWQLAQTILPVASWGCRSSAGPRRDRPNCWAPTSRPTVRSREPSSRERERRIGNRWERFRSGRRGGARDHQGFSSVRKSVSDHWLTKTLSFSTLTWAKASERRGPRTTPVGGVVLGRGRGT